MKKKLYLFALSFISFICFAQAPESILDKSFDSMEQQVTTSRRRAAPAISAPTSSISGSGGTSGAMQPISITDSLQPPTSLQQPSATNQQQTTTKKRKTIRDEAFKQMLNRTLPMRPDQLVTLRKELDKSKLAVSTTPSAPPTPVSSTLTVDLSPGSPSPVIRLATGFVSSLVFLDVTGQPWQIADYSLGNSRDFNIQWDQKTNTMFMQSTKDYASGNMAVRLAKFDTPIMISLVTGQKVVDFRIDLHVKARGPKAIIPILEANLPVSAKSTLLTTLDGVPPQNSVEIEVVGNYGRAWLHNGKLLFRTKLNLLSPAWTAKVSSADGTKVYELCKTPVLLASKNGKPIKIYFKGT